MGTGGRDASVRLLPESAMKGVEKPPRVIGRVKGGHFKSWITAAKEGKDSCSDFKVPGPCAEWLPLGMICLKFLNQKLMWDSKNLKSTNCNEANKFVKPSFREGWELKNITWALLKFPFPEIA
jgi:hypothetical protein